jgi:cyclophilin family peptidyl-prolyl cis-trans isomerase
MAIKPACTYHARLLTSKGTIVVALDAKHAPMAVNNFVFLSRHHFYTNILFHRVIKGFMIQTGDPTGTGGGGPGYQWKVENPGSSFPVGTVAMANAGPGTNGSQFFICQGAQCSGLNSSAQTGPGYTVFGHVISGMPAVNAIASVPVKANSQGEQSSPVKPVYLKFVTIAEAR